jgi:hypothetical protein
VLYRIRGRPREREPIRRLSGNTIFAIGRRMGTDRQAHAAGVELILTDRGQERLDIRLP